MEKKRLIYAEDFVNEIMQYPSRNFSKKLIQQCAEKVIAEKEVVVKQQSVWQKLRELFKR